MMRNPFFREGEKLPAEVLCFDPTINLIAHAERLGAYQAELHKQGIRDEGLSFLLILEASAHLLRGPVAIPVPFPLRNFDDE